MEGPGSLLPLGVRGVHLKVENHRVHIHKYSRDTNNLDTLKRTQIGIQLGQQEWMELLGYVSRINEVLERARNNDEDPHFTHPIGQNGIHVVTNKFEGHLLIQLREYFTPFLGPRRLLPTKNGIALKVDEWDDMCGQHTKITEALGRT